jgi:citrate lyase subunit beta / citryl-CoA lyase
VSGLKRNQAGAGEAGHSGPEIRSDVHVRIEPRERGGISVELESRVNRTTAMPSAGRAEEVLEALGVKHAQVAIHDEGALPFVIAARIEAAARRAGLGEGTRVLPGPVSLPDPSPRDRMRRSRLYVPGSEPKYFINAALHGADAIILDLEDSVHPNEKDAARLLVRNALRAVDFLQCERMVRINQLPLGLEDLGGDRSRISRPDSHSQGRDPEPGDRSQSEDRGDQGELRHHSSHLADADSGVGTGNREGL